MGNLANSLADASEAEAAPTLRDKVLEVRQRVLGPEHPKTLIAMRNLAASYEETGESEQAHQLREQAAQMRQRVQGRKHPDIREPASVIEKTER